MLKSVNTLACSVWRIVPVKSSKRKFKKHRQASKKEIAEDQCCLGRFVGTNEGIFIVRLISQDIIKKNWTTILGFVDIEDLWIWCKLFEIIIMIGLKYKE